MTTEILSVSFGYFSDHILLFCFQSPLTSRIPRNPSGVHIRDILLANVMSSFGTFNLSRIRSFSLIFPVSHFFSDPDAVRVFEGYDVIHFLSFP